MAPGRNGASAQRLAVEELKNEAENVTNQDQSPVERNVTSLDQTKKLKNAKRKAACSVSIFITNMSNGFCCTSDAATITILPST